MKIDGKKLEAEGVLGVARLMAVAARTAPKARGRDNIECVLLTNNDLTPLIEEMRKIGTRWNRHGFLRDAESLKAAACVLFLGTRIEQIELEEACAFCGYKNCTENRAHNGICVFNPNDLGIAVGSAVSVAADHRVDSRILYTAGRAAVDIGLFSTDVKIAFGVPLSVSGKNPFFDRKS